MDWIPCNVDGFVKLRCQGAHIGFIHGDTARHRALMPTNHQLSLTYSLARFPASPCGVPAPHNRTYNSHPPIRALSSDLCRSFAKHACRELNLTVAVLHSGPLQPLSHAADSSVSLAPSPAEQYKINNPSSTKKILCTKHLETYPDYYK